MRERGAALVEFALMALVVYLLFAGGIELGRMIFVSQVLQDAARLAARELSVTPIPADARFDQALMYTDGASVNVKAQIWDPTKLVIDMDEVKSECAPGDSPCVDTRLRQIVDGLPLVNRALYPVFINDLAEVSGCASSRSLLRYPGTLLRAAAGAGCPSSTAPDYSGGFTVQVALVDRDATGQETTIRWVDVLEEVRSNPDDAKCGTFSLPPPTPLPTDCGTGWDPAVGRGIAAVRVNYPFQSAALSAFHLRTPAELADPNIGNEGNLGDIIAANDDGVTTPGVPRNGAEFLVTTFSGSPDEIVSPGAIYSGKYGLGSQQALRNSVRPYRKVLLGQAMFRREVIQ